MHSAAAPHFICFFKGEKVMRHFVQSAVVAVLLSVAVSGWAQSTGGISGSVKDATGAVLPGVTIEVSSPALIEKVRTAVSDDQGNYKITDLRAGVYTVMFTLPGFATYRREGIELTSGFTATANAEMKIGSLEETVTVTGASPIVDVQNVRTQSVISAKVLDELPVVRTVTGFAAMTLGATAQVAQGVHDTGGNRGENSSTIAIHGGRGTDMRRSLDGMPFSSLRGSGGGMSTLFRVNMAGIQETVLETLSSAEAETGGVQLNYLPKDGGNILSIYGTANYADENLSAENLNDDLRSRGLTQSVSVRKIYDYGFGVGGPIAEDRLWFYGTGRKWGAQEYQPGAYLNKTVNTLFYTPDFDRQLYTNYPMNDVGARLTWQAGAKDKFTASINLNKGCLCNRGNAQTSLEATSFQWVPWARLIQATWSRPITNRLLFQAGTSFGIFPQEKIPMEGLNANAISVRELSTNLLYGAHISGLASGTGYDDTDNDNFNQRLSVSYVTGSHALKLGTYTMQGADNSNPYVLNPVAYSFRNQVPVSLTLWASPLKFRLRLRNVGLYAQDQWTIKRLTLNLGIRYDHFSGFTLPDSLPERDFAPARSFGRVERVPYFHDIGPRFGAAYDLSGDGRTALKVFGGRYVESLGIGYTVNAHPAVRTVESTTRAWNDANGNYAPDCNLKDPNANGECGAFANRAFGTEQATLRYAADANQGWGNRGYTWQTSASIQHEIRPGFGVNVGYFRTWFGSFTVTDNRAVTSADHDPYCITLPSDPRLPGGGGNKLCDLYDIKPTKFGQVDDIITQMGNFGKRTEGFNGMDIGMSLRFLSAGMLTGGVSFGRTVLDNCAVVDSPHQKVGDFCKVTPPWAANSQVKFQGSYPLPAGFAVSGTFQNLPGVLIGSLTSGTSLAVPNSQIAPSLGRNLSAGPNATVTIPIVAPAKMYEKRLSQVDLRLTKNFRFGKTKLQGQFDVYNIFNGATVLAVNSTFGPQYLNPTGVMGPRLFKFGAQFDF